MTTVFGADTGRGHLLFYILFGFILSCGQLFPELRFQHFSSDDGLSSNSVRATIIDQEGFLWVSTTNGLNRYDGYQFKHFFHKSDDPLSLSNSSIHALALDSKGRLWIGTKKGLNRYLPSSGSFKRYMAVNGVVQKNKNEKYGLTNDYISTILATRNGDLYVGTRDGLYRYEESEDRWIRMRPRLELNGTALPNIRVAAMTEAKNGDIWVATYQKNIIIIDPMTGTYKPISMVVNQGDPLVSGHINIIYADSKNRIWIGYYSLGMAYVEPEKERFVHFPYDQTRSRTKGFPSKSVKYILEDSRGVIWLATWANGLIKAIEKQSGFRFESYRKNPEDIHSILDDRVLFLMEDRINQIWASTIRGLELISFDRQKFKWHRHVANRPGITSSDVTSLLEDSLGNVWFGTYNHGISRINHADGSYTHFKYDPKKKNGLKNNGIWSIFEDSQKRIWVGTTRGLHRYVPDSDRFKFIDFKSQGPIFNRNIMIVREDSMGYLWLGTWVGGLNRWHPDSGESIHFKEDLNNPETISFNTVTTIQEDTEGRVWMGSPGDGLCYFDLKKKRFRDFFHDNQDKHSIASNVIYDIALINRTEIWILTEEGICIYEGSKDHFTRFLDLYGMNPIGAAILEGKDGTIWISSKKGLWQWNRESNQLKHFDKSDGLIANQFSLYAKLKRRNGNILFASPKGVIEFNPGDIRKNTFKPPVVLTDFYLFNKRISVDPKGKLPADIGCLNHCFYIIVIIILHLSSRLSAFAKARKIDLPISWRERTPSGVIPIRNIVGPPILILNRGPIPSGSRPPMMTVSGMRRGRH